MNDPLLTKDGSFTLHSDRYGQTYHSSHGALTEAHHVFLSASGVSERLRQGLDTRVLEVGFGLGLNALLTADLAVTHGARLDYHAFEHDLLSADVMSQLSYHSLLEQPVVADELQRLVLKATQETLSNVTGSEPPASDTSSSLSHRLSENVHLTLHLQDATATNLEALCGTGFQAVYLDAFSPDTNAECWSADFFTELLTVMTQDALLSTYSAKGSVRRAMQAAGLTVRKLTGPPGKREMLVGSKT